MGSGYRPELYVEPAHGTSVAALGTATQNLIARMQIQYPGVGCQREGDTWQVTIPDVYRVGHEAHFAEVFKTYLNDLDKGDRDWEMPNMLAKYYTTTKALAIAQQSPLSSQD